ncbi:DUF4349 domain-containing protein [Sphingomonas solaris]|nr:DUF4349 domain-containing protein [Sphingomonas solaris]
MRRGFCTAAMTVLLLGGCSKAPEGTTVAKEALPPGGAAAASAIKVSVPQIAYTFGYSYRVPSGEIAALQDRHIALCDRLGPAGCRVIGMQRESDDTASASGSLTLAVSAPAARAFGRALTAAAARSGGSEADSSIAAEDLSKQIVDTEARLRARQALADRLMELLRTRTGPVADLVAAERSVAAVQEEIDAARSWLAEARGRVAMSTVEVRYVAGDGGVFGPLRPTLATMGSFFGQSLALLLQLAVVVVPWAVLAGAIAYGVRRLRRRRRISDDARITPPPPA